MRARTGKCRVLPVATLALAALGCAPANLMKNPDAWPAQWAGRTLFSTPNAYIFATRAPAAGELDRAFRGIQSAFVRNTKGCSGRGLMIVNDCEDPIIEGNWKAIYIADKCANPVEPMSADAAEKSWTDLVSGEEMADSGLSRDQILQMEPLALTASDAGKYLHLDEAMLCEVPWVAIVPTRRLLQDNMHKAMEAGLKREKISVLQRLALAPFLVLFEPIMIDTLENVRDIVLYRACTLAQTDWDDARRREVVRIYAKERLGEMEEKISEAGAKMAAPSAPAASQPESRPADTGIPLEK